MANDFLDSDDIKRQELEDLTTCSICTEVYTYPIVLPCVHTFCMKCLQETGLKINKRPGEEMRCPLCRQMFKIPEGGFHELPKNVFVERLIQVADVSPQSIPICDACVEESKEEGCKKIPAANKYCVDCNQKFCEECCRQHTKFKLTKKHKMVPMTEHEDDQKMMTNLASGFCELHEQNDLNAYCAECKAVVCAFCFIDDHKNHEGSHVNKFVDDFRKQIETNAEAMNECRSKAEIKKSQLLKVKEDIQKKVEKLECDIEKRKNELKQSADKHATSHLQGVYLIRQSKLKEIQMATDDIDTYLSSLETYNSYCQKIMAKGSASSICRAFSNLSVRAVELQEQCQLMIEIEIQSSNLCFRKSELEEFLEESCGNLIGEIQEEGDSKPKKGSKQSLLAEQNDEIESLRREIDIERIDKEILRLENEDLRIDIIKEIQANKALTEELSKEKDKYDAHLKQMEQELDNNKITINTLHADNDKLKQELDKKKLSNHCLQTNNPKAKLELDQEGMADNSLQVVQEVNRYKTTISRLENNVEKLKQESETTKTEKFRYKSEPVLVQTIRTKAAEKKKKDICGLTILDKELFVVNYKSSEVEVYDSMTLRFRRRLNLKDLFRPMDIGSCKRNKCIYVFDFKGCDQSKEILRVDPHGYLIKNWSTRDDWGWGLSVTDESNVILSVFEKNKLNEYSSDGQLIREINLSDAGICHPMHAIKLTNGHFLISHGHFDDDLHRICIVDADGKLNKSFGEKCGSSIRQMNRPFYLSVDRNGFVMVSDRENSRILLLDSDLEFKREFVSKEEKHELRRPQRILLDDSNGRLFVTDSDSNSDGQIFIFDFK